MSRICVFLAFGVVALSSCFGESLFSQQTKEETEFGIFESRNEYSQFMGGLKRLDDPEINSLIPAINDMVLGQPIGQTANQYGIGQRDGLMSLLTRPEVRKEIDMIDSQFGKLQSVNQDIQSSLAKQFLEIDLSNAGEVLSSIQDINSQARSRLETVLSPAQKKRLRQLALQNVLRNVSLVDLLTADPLATELKLDEKKREGLKVDAKKIEKDLQEEIAKLRKEARKKLVSKLSLKQQKQLKDLLGESFLFSNKPEKRPPTKTKRKIKKKR